jgi:ISXO2-like transposase domain
VAREGARPKPAGRVEVDDAHLGGERSGGKRGRGAAGKTPIVAAVETTPERKPKRLRLSVVKGFRKKEVEKLAKRDVAPGSTVVSDGLSCWSAVEKAGCEHRPMVTGSGKRAAGWTPFRWVNTTVGNIKTAIAGTYHHVSPKHAQIYLTSFAYRFNRRFQLDSIEPGRSRRFRHGTGAAEMLLPLGAGADRRGPRQAKAERNEAILAAHGTGKSIHQIAHELGMPQQPIHYVIATATWADAPHAGPICQD